MADQRERDLARRVRGIARELEDVAIEFDGPGDGQIHRQILDLSREISAAGETIMGRGRDLHHRQTAVAN